MGWIRKIVKDWFYILAFIFSFFLFSFDYLKGYYNVLFIFIIVEFIFIIFYKFFIANKKEHPFDDNRFMAITSIVALIGLILTIYSKALIDNNSDLTKLITNSISDESVYYFATNDIGPNDYVICVDKSGSVNESNIKLPSWLNRKKLINYFDNLNIETDEKKIEKFISKGIKNTTQSFINKCEAIRLIQQPKLNSNNTYLILFGNNAVIKNGKNDDDESLKNLVSSVISAKNNNKETDFIRLFKKLHKSFEGNVKSSFDQNSKTIIILSDFYHDVKLEGKGTKADKQKADSDTLEFWLRKISKKDYGLHLVLIDQNKSIVKGNKNNVFIDVKKILDNITPKIEYEQYNNVNNYIYYNSFKGKNKISFFYRNMLFDSTSCLVYFSPPKENLHYNISFEEITDNNGDFYYTLNDGKTDRIPNHFDVESDEEFSLTYKGTIPSQCNAKLIIESPSNKLREKVNITFINIMPKFIAFMLNYLLALLFFFQLIYFSNMNFKTFLSKYVKALRKI